MKLIVGLGNPGPRYVDSRHNIGFVVVDEMARRRSAEIARHDRHFAGLLGEARIRGQRVILLKPQTFMNLSGRCVAAVWRFYKMPAEDVLVIYDDLDLPVGRLRVRASGSAGGHKGMTDVIQHLGTDQISRVRIGIGKVHPSATTEYVLGRFEPDERPAIEAAVAGGADAAECWVGNGVVATMNQFNRRPDAGSRSDSGSEGESS